MESIRVFNISTRHWLIGFIAAHGLLVLMMAITIGISGWVESTDEHLGFRGHLLGVSSSEQFNSESYIDIHDHYQKLIDETEEEINEDQGDNEDEGDREDDDHEDDDREDDEDDRGDDDREDDEEGSGDHAQDGTNNRVLVEDEIHEEADVIYAIAALFGTLAFCGCFFVVCELLAIFSSLITLLLYSFLLCKGVGLLGSFESLALSVIFHSVATIGYMAHSSITLSDDCDDFYDGRTPNAVCAKAGPSLALAVFVLYLLFAILSTLVMCLVRKKKVAFREKQVSTPSCEMVYPGLPADEPWKEEKHPASAPEYPTPKGKEDLEDSQL